MSKLLGPFAAVLAAIFALAVGGGVLYYSFHGLELIFPGDLLGVLFGMALFDLAAFVWFLTFIALSRSTMQYVFAAIGFLIGLSGTLFLVGIEVGVSSSWLVADDMARPLSYLFILVMIGHLVLIYARHAAAPEISAEISLGVEKARIVGEAQRDAEKMLLDNTAALSTPIARELVKGVLEQLHLRVPAGDVLDLQALEVVEPSMRKDSAGGENFLSGLARRLGIGGRKPAATVKNAATTSGVATLTPSPAVEDVGPVAGGESKPNA